MSDRPGAAKITGSTASYRLAVPAADWGSPANREAIWARMRDMIAWEAGARGIAILDGPGERTSQYIRFHQEDGTLKCDLGATESTATDVWLQLTVALA